VSVLPHCNRIMLRRARDQHNVSHTHKNITLCQKWNCNAVSSHYLGHFKYLHISRASKTLTEDFRNYRIIYSRHSPWIHEHEFLRHTETGTPKYEPSRCSVSNMWFFFNSVSNTRYSCTSKPPNLMVFFLWFKVINLSMYFLCHIW